MDNPEKLSSDGTVGLGKVLGYGRFMVSVGKGFDYGRVRYCLGAVVGFSVKVLWASVIKFLKKKGKSRVAW